MDTKDIPTEPVSHWRREPSEQLNAAIGKLGEEAAELASRCCRCMIQGVDEFDPGDKRTNLAHLEDEMADVYAMLKLVERFVSADTEAIAIRRDRKYVYKLPWLKALPK